jgi:hypothetical protein
MYCPVNASSTLQLYTAVCFHKFSLFSFAFEPKDVKRHELCPHTHHCLMKMFIFVIIMPYYCLPLKLSLFSSPYLLDIPTYNYKDYATCRDQRG